LTSSQSPGICRDFLYYADAVPEESHGGEQTSTGIKRNSRSMSF
jgi:hypothetical protein